MGINIAAFWSLNVFAEYIFIEFRHFRAYIYVPLSTDLFQRGQKS